MTNPTSEYMKQSLNAASLALETLAESFEDEYAPHEMLRVDEIVYVLRSLAEMNKKTANSL